MLTEVRPGCPAIRAFTAQPLPAWRLRRSLRGRAAAAPPGDLPPRSEENTMPNLRALLLPDKRPVLQGRRAQWPSITEGPRAAIARPSSPTTCPPASRIHRPRQPRSPPATTHALDCGRHITWTTTQASCRVLPSCPDGIGGPT